MATAKYQTAGLDSQTVEIDPSAPGTVVRYAMLLESILNLPFAVFCLAYPRVGLEFFFTNPSEVTPAAESLLQLYGLVPVFLSVILWAACQNTQSGIESRRLTYYMFLSAEIMMISLWVWQGWVIGEEKSGWKKSGLQAAIVNIAPLVLFRSFALFVKPEWFGRYRVKAKAA